jgi:hypothetical protein
LCTATSTGSCATACAVPSTGNYHIANVDASSNCVTATCAGISPACTQVQKRDLCGGNTAGTCSACSPGVTLNLNSYWTHALNSATCTQASCLSCNPGFRNTLCSATSTGSCATACAAAPLGSYFIANVDASSNCVTNTCLLAPSPCTQVQRRDSCGGNSAGTCIACSPGVTLNLNSYWTHALNSATCTQASCLSCNPGFRNTLCSATSTGSCATACAAAPLGSYFIANVDASSNCVTNTCLNAPSPCTQTEKRVGCGSNTAGTCSACSPGVTLNLNSYWTHAVNADTCTQAVYLVPTIGRLYASKSASGMGVMTDCTAPASNKYFVTPTTLTTDCQTADKIICQAGKQNTGSSATLPGVCTADCTGQANGTYWTTNTVWNICASANCANDCPTGQWRSACAGILSGICTGCTTANASQVYETNGGWSNVCQVKNCVKDCLNGYYITGCGLAGATDLTVGCGICNNAGVNDKFWTGQGAYLANSCPTNACATCPNGNFRSGCGGLSAGTCTNCNNV